MTKLNEKEFESQMMKEFNDLRSLAGVKVTSDPVQSAYHGYRAGRMISKDEEEKKNSKKRENAHVVE